MNDYSSRILLLEKSITHMSERHFFLIENEVFVYLCIYMGMTLLLLHTNNIMDDIMLHK